MILLNFSDSDADGWVQFPFAGQWVEQIDIADNPKPPIPITQDGHRAQVRVPSNYGAVYLKQ